MRLTKQVLLEALAGLPDDADVIVYDTRSKAELQVTAVRAETMPDALVAFAAAVGMGRSEADRRYGAVYVQGS